MITRRSFFQDVALLSALAALAEKEGYAQANDESMSKFWDAYFSEATRDPTAPLSRGDPSLTDPNKSLVDPNKKAQLIHATKDGLRYPDAIADSELRSDSDVVVTVNPEHFRPAPDDHKAISKSKGCQIRLDWVQIRPIMNLIAPMAWSGLAAWSLEKAKYDPKTKKTTWGPNPPNLRDLDFRDPNDPNAPPHNQVILMGGGGRMALNVRAVSVNQRLQSVLDRSVRYSSIVAPFFGFAPLAIPALRAFTDLLGAVFNHEAVIMNSMPLHVLATQDAKKGAHATSSVKIVSGEFIAVPIDQTANLKGNLDKLRVVDGWLVHQDGRQDVPIEQRAQDSRIPEVTYMSIAFTVQSLAEAQKQKSKGG
jgi:hypothetical protein